MLQLLTKSAINHNHSFTMFQTRGPHHPLYPPTVTSWTQLCVDASHKIIFLQRTKMLQKN